MAQRLQHQQLKGTYPHPSSNGISAIMRANRKRDTGPELRLRSELHARGLRFRANHMVEVSGLRVRPDVVFTRHKVAVFVDGCFWHSCRWHGTKPRANTGYWLPKLARVADRDRLVKRQLARAGWTVIRIWEHVESGRAADLVSQALMLGYAP